MATTIGLAVPIRDVVHYHSPENRQLTGLAKALHDHGMYLGLEVVVNHLATSALPTPFIACTAFNQGQKLTLAAPSRATTRCAPHKRRLACIERPPTHSPPRAFLRGARFELGRPVPYARALTGVRAIGRLECRRRGMAYIGDYTSQSVSRFQCVDWLTNARTDYLESVLGYLAYLALTVTL